MLDEIFGLTLIEKGFTLLNLIIAILVLLLIIIYLKRDASIKQAHATQDELL